MYGFITNDITPLIINFYSGDFMVVLKLGSQIL